MLSVAEIKRLIDEDSTSARKHRASIGQRYYEGKHDIEKCRFFFFNSDGKLVEDTMRSNVKISHPFFTELSDQFSAHMISFKEDSPIQAKENVEGLQEHLDTYFDGAFWAEMADLISGAYNKGFDYLYAKKNEEERLTFEYAEGMGVVEVRKEDTDDDCEYIIYWYIDRIEKNKKEIRRIQVWDASGVTFYVQEGSTGKIELDKSVELNPRPHFVYIDETTGKRMGSPLGYIPFFPLKYNRKEISGVFAVKDIIDDYDRMMCGLSNNLVDFDTPIHVVKGYEGQDLDALQLNLKTKKVIGTDSEGGIEVHTVSIPYEARKVKAEADEKAIYHHGMGLNTYGLKDMNATTNIGIKAAYEGLEQKSKKFEPRLEAFLKNLVKIVLAEINEKNGTDYQISDVKFVLDRATMTNEAENLANDKIAAEVKQIEVNTVLNVAAQVGDEQALKAICKIMEWDFEELKGELEKAKEEQSTATAKSALEAVPVEGEPIEV